MSTQTRIKQLEKNSGTIQAGDTRELKRYIGADGNKFFIDGVEVSYGVYIKAETAQIDAAKARGDFRIDVRFVGEIPED